MDPFFRIKEGRLSGFNARKDYVQRGRSNRRGHDDRGAKALQERVRIRRCNAGCVRAPRAVSGKEGAYRRVGRYARGNYSFLSARVLANRRYSEG